MDRVLLALDGSDGAWRALAVAVDIAGRFDAELVIAHVVIDGEPDEEDLASLRSQHPGLSARLQPALERAAMGDDRDTLLCKQRGQAVGEFATPRGLIGDSLLKEAEGVARASGVNRVRTILIAGEPADTILELAEMENIALIVVGRRGLCGMGAILMESISTRIAQMAAQNVLIVA